MVEFPDKLAPLFKPMRYKVLFGGRGGAKSWGVARALLIRGWEHPIKVLCAREYQNSIKDSVHRLLSQQVESLGLSHFYEIQGAAIKGRNGTEFSFEGIRQNVTRIKSYESVNVVWVEEAQRVTKNSWDVLIPTIRAPGSEIWMTFNPEFEDDETFQRFVVHPPANAVVVEMSYRDNPWFPEVLEHERLALKARDPDAYDHVWEGKCRQWLEGAIYANELREMYEDGRATRVKHDKAAPVHTAWDLGHSDDTAIIWYQVIGDEIHVLEGFSASGLKLADYATQILGREVRIDVIDGEIGVRFGRQIKDLAHRQRYQYGWHWLPHDARARHLAAGGRSTQEQLAEVFGWNAIRIVPELSLADGLQAARSLFKSAWFDADGCSELLKALRSYRRDFMGDEVSLRRNPRHDWASHYSDAFRYLALSWRKPRVAQAAPLVERDPWGRPIHDGNWKTA